MIPQNLFMLALFGDFYYKSYVQKKTKKREPVAITPVENETSDKIYTNGDSRHRYTNGNPYTNGDARNGYLNGNSNGNAPNGYATKGKTNGNVIQKINEMS